MNPRDQLPLPLPAGRDAAHSGRDANRGDRAFEIKGSTFSLLSMLLKSDSLEHVARDLDQQIARAPGVFDVEPVVIDCKEAAAPFSRQIEALLDLLRSRGLHPVGVCNAEGPWRDAALEAGLGVLEGAAPAPKRAAGTDKVEPATGPEKARATGTPPREVQPPAVHVVRKTVRTGQRVFAADGDLTLLAAVNAGAEVLATGSIHVYAPLRGRALAGVQGDSQARIFTLCMEAELVSIAGTYRVLDRELAADVRGKAAQIYLDGEKLVIEPLRV